MRIRSEALAGGGKPVTGKPVTDETLPTDSTDDWSRGTGLASPKLREPANGISARSGALQRVYKLFCADARLTEYALERANYQVAMHKRGARPISSGCANVRTGSPGNREAQPLQSLERLGSRDVPRRFHA